jgi:hypothetical protein
MEIDFEIVKTSRDKDAILAKNFVYNYKITNKDGCNCYVFNQGNYYSSQTVQNEKFCKFNGKLILTEDLALSH